jgi:hypothetical protein
MSAFGEGCVETVLYERCGEAIGPSGLHRCNELGRAEEGDGVFEVVSEDVAPSSL